MNGPRSAVDEKGDDSDVWGLRRRAVWGSIRRRNFYVYGGY